MHALFVVDISYKICHLFSQHMGLKKIQKATFPNNAYFYSCTVYTRHFHPIHFGPLTVSGNGSVEIVLESEFKCGYVKFSLFNLQILICLWQVKRQSYYVQCITDFRFILESDLFDILRPPLSKDQISSMCLAITCVILKIPPPLSKDQTSPMCLAVVV